MTEPLLGSLHGGGVPASTASPVRGERRRREAVKDNDHNKGTVNSDGRYAGRSRTRVHLQRALECKNHPVLPFCLCMASYHRLSDLITHGINS